MVILEIGNHRVDPKAIRVKRMVDRVLRCTVTVAKSSAYKVPGETTRSRSKPTGTHSKAVTARRNS
jgi:hypothetical protein